MPWEYDLDDLDPFVGDDGHLAHGAEHKATHE